MDIDKKKIVLSKFMSHILFRYKRKMSQWKGLRTYRRLLSGDPFYTAKPQLPETLSDIANLDTEWISEVIQNKNGGVAVRTLFVRPS